MIFVSTPVRLLFWQTVLTRWDRVTHICVVILTITGSPNGLSPDRRQAIIWTNDGTLLIEPSGTKFSEILIKSHTFSFTKKHLKMSAAKWRPFCFGLNALINQHRNIWITPIYHKPGQNRVDNELGVNLVGYILFSNMMTSPNGNIFSVTDPLWGNSPVNGELH